MKSHAARTTEHAATAGSARVRRAPVAPRPDQDAARAGVRALLGPALRFKLEVGPADDRHEREADAVAERVMRMPEPAAPATVTPDSRLLRRQTEEQPAGGAGAPAERGPDSGGGEAAAWPAPTPEEVESLGQVRRKAAAEGGGAVADTGLASRIAAPGPGRPLPAAVRRFVEPRLGYDFSAVRVHDGEADREDAAALRARAFTYGSHVWVGRGESAEDARLMAHELTHVVQQGGAVRRAPEATAVAAAPRRVQRGLLDALSDPLGALLDKAKQWARKVPGYTLLTVILGRDPISDEVVERNATNLVRGVLGLVPGGEAVFENLQKSGALERAFAWLREQIAALDLTWERIKGLFRTAWDAVSMKDALDPSGALGKVMDVFAPPLARLKSFAVAAGRKLLEFVFEGAMALAGSLGQQVLGIVRKAGDVVQKIVDDPVGFLRNLVAAVRQGFEQFAGNILTHLKEGLMQWLFGALASAGIQMPAKLDLMGVVSIVLQVLGLTYAKLRAKLVKVIGEPRVAFLEKAFEFIATLVTQGLAAAWRKLVEFMGNLQDMVMGAIRDWVVTKIVTAAVTKLVSMFNPVGAVIQAIKMIYDTVTFFIERAQQVMALANAVFDSVANIAAGRIADAANYVERTMAKAIPVLIGFLASLIGLGGISERIREIIRQIQEKVDAALTKVVNFVVEKAKALFGKSDAKEPAEDVAKMTPEARKQAALAAVEKRLETGVTGDELAVTALPEVKTRYRLSDVQIDRQDPEKPVIQFYASKPLPLTVEHQVQKTKGGAATGASLTVRHEGSMPTPLGAVRAVYKDDTNDSGFAVRSKEWVRAKEAEGTLLPVQGGDERPSDSTVTDAGRLGRDEHWLATGEDQSYDGGHLIAYRFLGAMTNEESNLAPQLGSFNRGPWKTFENLIAESPLDGKKKVKGAAGAMKAVVRLTYSGRTRQFDYATLKKRKAIAASAPDRGPVEVPVRVPGSWYLQVTVQDPSYRLASRDEFGSTTEASQVETAAAGAKALAAGDKRFVWYKLGKAKQGDAGKVGGEQAAVFEAQQASP
jgi:hypothetical protein